MADTKFSQITSGGNLAALTDKLLAVRSGTSDVLVTPPASYGNFNILDYDAKVDGMRLFDCSIPDHGNTITSASYSFVAGDVGKCVTVSPAINQFSGTPLPIPVYTGTILSVSAGVATMAGNQSGSTITGNGVVAFGTDDTAAIQSAIVAACPLGNPTSPTNTVNRIQGGTVIIPRGITMITAGLVMRTEVSIVGQGYNASCVKWISTVSMATPGYEGAFIGLTGNGSTRWYGDNEFLNLEIDMDAAQVNSGYGYQAKAIEILYCSNMTVRGCYIHGSPATAVGVDFQSNLIFTNNIVVNAGHLKPTNVSTGGGCGVSWEASGTSFGINIGYETVVIADNIFINCHNSAIEPEGDLTNPSNARATIANNMIITSQTFGNGIRDKCLIGNVITGNVVVCTGVQTIGVGIGAVYGGVLGLIENNYIEGFYNGITVEDTFSTSSNGYSIRGNTVKSSVNNGIQILQDSPNTLSTLNITDNYVDNSGAAGLAFVHSTDAVQHVNITNAGSGYTAGTYALGFSGGSGTGAAGTYTVDGTLTVVSTVITAGGSGYLSAPTVSFPSGGGTGAAGTAIINTPGTISNLLMACNTLSNNGKTTAIDIQKSDILISDTLTDCVLSNNYCFGTKYGMTVSTAIAVTKALIDGNKVDGATTSGFNIIGTLTGWIANNPGYNPIGVSAVTPGASPWTYTAGSTPEVLYLLGGTVSAVVKNSVTLATALSSTQSLPITLDPGEAVVVTYTVAPTANKDQK